MIMDVNDNDITGQRFFCTIKPSYSNISSVKVSKSQEKQVVGRNSDDISNFQFIEAYCFLCKKQSFVLRTFSGKKLVCFHKQTLLDFSTCKIGHSQIKNDFWE